MGTSYIRWVPEDPVTHRWQSKYGKGLTDKIDEALQFKTYDACRQWILEHASKLVPVEHMFVGGRDIGVV